MADRFHMSLVDNIELARRNLVDSIHKEAVVEGMDVTFPQMVAILDGFCEGVGQDDLMKIANLERAWHFVLDSITYAPVGLSYLRALNGFIQQGFGYTAGNLRTFRIRIQGTGWSPAPPTPETIARGLEEAASEGTDTDRALRMMLEMMRGQYFEDGNKSTAQLAANHELIRLGRGVLAIPPDMKEDFAKLLADFYETGRRTEIMDFLREECLGGFVRTKPPERFDVQKEAARFVGRGKRDG